MKFRNTELDAIDFWRFINETALVSYHMYEYDRPSTKEKKYLDYLESQGLIKLGGCQRSAKNYDNYFCFTTLDLNKIFLIKEEIDKLLSKSPNEIMILGKNKNVLDFFIADGTKYRILLGAYNPRQNKPNYFINLETLYTSLSHYLQCLNGEQPIYIPERIEIALNEVQNKISYVIDNNAPVLYQTKEQKIELINTLMSLK